MILADKIITLRKKRGWSQEQLAEQLNVSRQSVSKWESAMSVPDMDKIVKMSNLFGVSTDYLLKDEIENIQPGTVTDKDDTVKTISLEYANEYMDAVQSVCGKIAAAVSLFILSPIPAIVRGYFADSRANGGRFFVTEDAAAGVGTALLLIMIAIGVTICILYGMKLDKYDYLEKEEIALEYGVAGVVTQKRARFENSFRTQIAAGVALCILGVVPMLFVSGLDVSDVVMGCMLCVLLACIALAVNIFIRAGMVWDSYSKLLQEGDYTAEKKLTNRKISFIPGVYWCVVAAYYLYISFTQDSWSRSWIVWPVAAVVFAAVMTAAGAIASSSLKNKK